MQPEIDPAAAQEAEAERVLAQDIAKMGLAVRLVDVMSSWPHATAGVQAADYDAIAHDIAAAVDRYEDGVLLAGLAYWEGARFAAYVDDGRCNDPVWRKSPEGQATMLRWGDCDHMGAVSLWQIHPIVDPSSKLYSVCNRDVVDVTTSTGSRIGAARCALAIARSSMQSTGDLSGYTGEAPVEGAHPKADERLAFVRRTLAKFPWRTPPLPKE
jgi:hypothetical protein